MLHPYSLLLLLTQLADSIDSRPLISTQPRFHSRNSTTHLLISARQLLPGVGLASSSPLLAPGAPLVNVTAAAGDPAAAAAPAPVAAAAPASALPSAPSSLGPSLAGVVTAYGLDASPWTWTFPLGTTSLPGPSSEDALSPESGATESWLVNSLNLYSNRIIVGPQNLAFVTLPSATGGQGTNALRVFYPDGSLVPSAHSKNEKRTSSMEDAPIGGTSFYAQPFAPSPNTTLSAAPIQAANPARGTLLLRYTVSLPADFNFVKGGKLPGLYSSVGMRDETGAWDANTDGCSGGGTQGMGNSCWSVRLMWREGGMGEVYAYFPTTRRGAYDPCRTQAGLICNSDYGTSLGRGAFSFKAGGSTTLTLLVQLNSGPNTANGRIALWADEKLAVHQEGLLLRTGTTPTLRSGHGGGSEASVRLPANLAASSGGAKWVDKVFFSSFFGGSTPDFAAQGDMSAYFSNFMLYSGDKYSDAKGLELQKQSGAGRVGASSLALGLSLALVLALLV